MMRAGMPVVHKLSCILQLLSALKYLSSQRVPVAHCDVKPENIFIKGRSCVLGDFGLIRVCDGTLLPPHAGEPPMPRDYRTPDLVAYGLRQAPLDVKSDVFQLGLVAAELFTQANPLRKLGPDDSKLQPCTLDSLGPIPGSYGLLMRRVIGEVLRMRSDERLTAAKLIDRWRTPFRNVASLLHALEGRVF